MTKEMPVILHISEYDPSDVVDSAAAYMSGEVIYTDNLMDALAAYVFYMPDVVVVEAPMGSWLGQEALFHLDSVDARPLVVITDRRDLWDADVVSGVFIRPMDIGTEAMIATLGRAMGLTPVW